MKLSALVLLGCLVTADAVAQDIHRASFQCADDTVIPVTGAGAAPDVLVLMKGFNSRFPVSLTANLIQRAAEGRLQSAEKNSIKNGFFMTAEDDDGNVVMAQVWNRSDGHRILGINFHVMADVLYDERVCFYDYDPAKETLTSYRDNPVSAFRPQFSTSTGVIKTYYSLEKSGVMVMNETVDGLLFGMTSEYAWNGSGFAFRGAGFSLTGKAYETVRGISPSEYAFYDIDGDGNSELLFRDRNHAAAVIVAVTPNAGFDEKKWNQPEVILSRTAEKDEFGLPEFAFYEKGAGLIGECGSGCRSFSYVALDRGRIASRAEGYMLTPEELERLGGPENTDAGSCRISWRDGKSGELSYTEVQDYVQKLGKTVKADIKWYPLTSLEKP